VVLQEAAQIVRSDLVKIQFVNGIPSFLVVPGGTRAQVILQLQKRVFVVDQGLQQVGQLHTGERRQYSAHVGVARAGAGSVVAVVWTECLAELVEGQQHCASRVLADPHLDLALGA